MNVTQSWPRSVAVWWFLASVLLSCHLQPSDSEGASVELPAAADTELRAATPDSESWRVRGDPPHSAYG